jgi:hypothetical protein
MVSRLGQWFYRHAQRGTDHPNWFVRRSAQLTVLGALAGGLALRGLGRPLSNESEEQQQFFERFAISRSLRDYVQARGAVQPWLGRFARTLLLLQAADTKLRELARPESFTCVLRLDRHIDQPILRNLLIWHNHLLRRDRRGGQNVDLMLLPVTAGLDESRLFDLISLAFLLERIRNVGVFWGVESSESAGSNLMSNLGMHGTQNGDDLARLSMDVLDHITRHGTSGGIKVPLDARRQAQDFFKAALARRIVIAVSLRENADGAIDTAELDWWLPLFDGLAQRHPAAAFVILNRLTPSQGHTWPAHIRVARHQGLSFQDAVAVAQYADGFVGVLDVFGLAANAAARPGVYIPLDGGELLGAQPSSAVVKDRQVMLASCDRVRIEAALRSFLADLGRL